MFILKKGHQPGVYVPLRALFLVHSTVLYEQSLSYIFMVDINTNDAVWFLSMFNA